MYVCRSSNRPRRDDYFGRVDTLVRLINWRFYIHVNHPSLVHALLNFTILSLMIRRLWSAPGKASLRFPTKTQIQSLSSYNGRAGNTLFGSRCMITGGSSGIGLGIAHRFLHEGAAQIVLVGRDQSRLRNAATQLRAVEAELVGHGVIPPAAEPIGLDAPHAVEDGRFVLIAGDVGLPEFWNEQSRKLMVCPYSVFLFPSSSDVDMTDIRHQDSVGTLVNAAGTSVSSLLPLTSDQDISAMLQTNLQGTILACKAFTRRLLRQRQRAASVPPKCIINVSSLHACRPGIGAATYASTKAGVIALTQALAAETAQFRSTLRSGLGLRINVLVPGYVDTRILGGMC